MQLCFQIEFYIQPASSLIMLMMRLLSFPLLSIPCRPGESESTEAKLAIDVKHQRWMLWTNACFDRLHVSVRERECVSVSSGRLWD